MCNLQGGRGIGTFMIESFSIFEPIGILKFPCKVEKAGIKPVGENPILPYKLAEGPKTDPSSISIVALRVKPIDMRILNVAGNVLSFGI